MKTRRVLFVAVVAAASCLIAALARAQLGTGAMANALNLTDAQKAAIKAIVKSTRQAVQDANSPAEKQALRQAAREQIKALLTPEQLAKLQQIRQDRAQAWRDRVAAVLAQLDLTAKQKIEVGVILERTRQALPEATTPADRRALVKAAWQQIRALLTPEQLAKLKDIRQGGRTSDAGIASAAGTAAALDLTDAQKAAIKAIEEHTRQAVQDANSAADKEAIRQAARQQIKALLTPEQLAELAKRSQGNAPTGQRLSAILAQLNLTAEQKSAIKAIRQSTRQAVQAATTPEAKRAIVQAAWQQIRGLLTPEQLAKLRQIRRQL